jgi:succinate dehydrogenase / fumarate reductase iron-sulfur subunit
MAEPRDRTATKPASSESGSKAVAPAGRVVVVGDGLAALMATLALADGGLTVDLLSAVEPRHGRLPLDGLALNAADLASDDADAELDRHGEETLRAGGELARPEAVEAMVAAAPQLVAQLVELGVPFDRTSDGSLARRRLTGSSSPGAVTAGDYTAQTIAFCLDDHLRRLESCRLDGAPAAIGGDEAAVRRLVGWELADLILDTAGTCAGVVALEPRSMSLRSFGADAVVLATGAASAMLAPLRSDCPDHAIAIAYRRGAVVANAELFAAASGAVAGADDPSIEADLGNAPGPVRPKLDEMIGGLWVDLACSEEGQLDRSSPRNHATTISGLYAVGGACHAYHGGGRLAGNSVLASLFGATLVGSALASYCAARAKAAPQVPADLPTESVETAEAELTALFDRESDEPGVHALHRELRRATRQGLGIGRDESDPSALLERIDELRQRAASLRPRCPRERPHGDAVALRHLESALELARISAACALRRDESRAGHHQTGSPQPAAQHGSPSLVRRAGDGAPEQVTVIEYDLCGETIRIDRPPPPTSEPASDDSEPSAAPRVSDSGAEAAPSRASKRRASRTDRSSRKRDAKQPDRIRLHVQRQDAADRPESRRIEQFELRPAHDWTVATALERINRDLRDGSDSPVEPIAWTGSCATGTCGACTMLINGVVRPACSTLLRDAVRGSRPVVLAPLSKFPLVRDLLVDRSRLTDDLAALAVWPDPPRPVEPGDPPAAENDGLQRARLALSRCNHCGACVEACPEAHPSRPFVGAAVLNRLRLLDLHPFPSPRRATRLESALGQGGIAGCAGAQNCAEVCPAAIPLDESLPALNRRSLRLLLRGRRD